MKEPLGYEIVRQRGSHRKLESRNGYTKFGFSFHDKATVPGGKVKEILVDRVGLSEEEARELL